MYINIDNILHKKRKNLQWLADQIKCNYSNLHKLVNNETKSISFELLEKICNSLDVGVEDILIIERK